MPYVLEVILLGFPENSEGTFNVLVQNKTTNIKNYSFFYILGFTHIYLLQKIRLNLHICKIARIR